MSNLDIVGSIVLVGILLTMVLGLQLFMTKGNVQSLEQNNAYQNANTYRQILKNEFDLIGLRSSDGIVNANERKIVYHTKKTFDSDASSIDLYSDLDKTVTVKFDTNTKVLQRKVNSNSYENVYNFKDIDDLEFNYYNSSGNLIDIATTSVDSIRFLGFKLKVNYEDPNSKNSLSYLTVEDRFLLKNIINW